MKQILFILAVMVLVGCGERNTNGAGDDARESSPDSLQQTVPVALLAQGQYCNLERGWRRIDDVDALPQSLPRVELADDDVMLLISMGTRPTGGFGITVPERAPMENGEVRLEVRFEVPPPDAMVTQALTSPCVLVALPVPAETPVEVVFTGPGA